jgi:hypothetical protein
MGKMPATGSSTDGWHPNHFENVFVVGVWHAAIEKHLQ